MWVRTCSDRSGGETANKSGLAAVCLEEPVGHGLVAVAPSSCLMQPKKFVHPLRSLLALRTMNLRMTLNLMKSLCNILCTPSRQSSGISMNVFPVHGSGYEPVS